MLEASVDPDPAITMQLLTACKMHSSVFYQVICLSLLVCTHFKKLQYEGLSGVVLSSLWKRNKKKKRALTRPKVTSAMERQGRLPLTYALPFTLLSWYTAAEIKANQKEEVNKVGRSSVRLFCSTCTMKLQSFNTLDSVVWANTFLHVRQPMTAEVITWSWGFGTSVAQWSSALLSASMSLSSLMLLSGVFPFS